MIKKLRVIVGNNNHKICVNTFLIDCDEQNGQIALIRDLITGCVEDSRCVDRVTYTYYNDILVHIYDTCLDIEVVDIAQKVEQFLTLLSHVKLFYFNQ